MRRIAVIGAGRMGELHARELAGLPDIDVGVASRDPERAARLAREIRRTSIASIDEVWSWRPDGVVIATSSDTHARLVTAALNAGVPAFVEKPVALALSDATAIAERSAETGIPIMVGYQRRYDVRLIAFRKAVMGSGTGGRLQTLRIRHSGAGAPPPGYVSSSGGMFLDVLSHDTDMVRWLTGREVQSVFAAGLCVDPEYAGDVDVAAVCMTLDNDALVVLEGSRSDPSGYSLTVESVYERGTVAIPPMVYMGRPCAWSPTFEDRFSHAFRWQMGEFANVATKGMPAGADAAAAVEALRISLAADLSNREGRLVHVRDVV